METLQAIYGDDFQSLTTAGSVDSNVYSILVSCSDNRCVTVKVNFHCYVYIVYSVSSRNFQQGGEAHTK